MDIVSLDSIWYKFIDRDWIDELDATPFLTRCRAGTATRRELHSFVRQQFYYSRHFTRYLGALLSNTADDHDRFELTRNLFEEMGLGDGGGTPHAAIYREMMAAMNVHAADEPEHPATSRLTRTMFEACGNQSSTIGLAAIGLGAEAIVPHLYSQIVAGFLAVSEPTERLEFFHIHIAGDDAHAVTMRNILERELQRDPAQGGAVRRVARKVIQARVRFLEAVGAPAISADLRERGRHAAL